MTPTRRIPPTLWYWEQLILGEWSPRTASEPPVPSKMRRISEPRRVPERLQGLTPKELQRLSWTAAVAILSGEGEAARVDGGGG